MERRLLAVHAHPDDESITTGGLLARCRASEIPTCLVTCTDGRQGPVNPDLGLVLTPDGLAQRRTAELGAAASLLGIGKVHRLGYRDSGMSASPHTVTPYSFCAQPLDVLVEVMVGIIRRFRPHVVVTYDPFGCTGHPDHVRTHRVTLLAVEAATEAHVLPTEGRPWTVSQVLYPVFPTSTMESFITEELQAGRPHPFEGRSAAEVNYTRPDETVTHRVDIREVYECKREALHAHRTQIGSHYPQLYLAALARREHEHFRLAWHRRPQGSARDFQDLFESVDL